MPTWKPSLSALSLSQLAELVGMDSRTVRKRLGEAGVEPVRRDRRTLYFDPRAALPAVWRDGKALDPAREAARFNAARADLAELDLAKKRGGLIEVARVEAMMARDYGFVKQRLLAIPSKLAPLVATLTDPAEIQRVMMLEHRQALEDLASASDLDESERQADGGVAGVEPV